MAQILRSYFESDLRRATSIHVHAYVHVDVHAHTCTYMYLARPLSEIGKVQLYRRRQCGIPGYKRKTVPKSLEHSSTVNQM